MCFFVDTWNLFPYRVPIIPVLPRLESPLAFGIRDIMLYMVSTWPQSPCHRRPGSFKGEKGSRYFSRVVWFSCRSANVTFAFNICSFSI